MDLATHYCQSSWIRNKTPMEITKKVYGKAVGDIWNAEWDPQLQWVGGEENE